MPSIGGAAATGALSGATTGLALGPWGAAVGAIVGAGINIFSGIKQKRDAEKAAAQNIEPTYSGVAAANRRLAIYQQAAMYGLDASTLAWQQDMNDRGLTRSLADMLQAGGNPNLVADLYGASTDRTAETASANAEAKWNKVQAVAALGMKDVEAEQEKDYLRQYQSFANKAQYYALKQNAGREQEFAGLDMLFGNTVKMLNDNYNLKTWQNWLSSYYGTGNGEQGKNGTTTTAGGDYSFKKPPFVPRYNNPNFNIFQKPWQQAAKPQYTGTNPWDVGYIVPSDINANYQ